MDFLGDSGLPLSSDKGSLPSIFLVQPWASKLVGEKVTQYLEDLPLRPKEDLPLRPEEHEPEEHLAELNEDFAVPEEHFAEN